MVGRKMGEAVVVCMCACVLRAPEGDYLAVEWREKKGAAY